MEFSSSLPIVVVTTEQLNAFYNIDRNVYTRLIVNLAFDPLKSIQTMGLWRWFERFSDETDLIFNLQSVEDNVINDFVEESDCILQCLEANEFTIFMETNNALPVTNNMTTSTFTLRYFFDNRHNIRGQVQGLLNELYPKAFEDIFEQVVQAKINARDYVNAYDHMASTMESPQTQFVPLNYGQIIPANFDNYYTYEHMYNTGIQHDPLQFDHINAQAHDLNKICDDLRSLSLFSTGEDDAMGNIPTVFRTIFLTFSDGYPISKNEIREFFTGTFGECIEAIHMQEVSSFEQQPLYAKLILFKHSQVGYVLGKKDKAKFTINGKYVWACKFVSKGGNQQWW